MGIAAIEEMVASQKGVDWVMVELTGVADPGELFGSCPSAELRYRTDCKEFLGE
jgi:G3E family GTPase